MKQWILGGAAAIAMTFASSAQAADGAISQSTLSAMGLGDAIVVTDAVASEVRGQGYAAAFGGSIAGFLGDGSIAGSLNVYNAKGKFAASGENFSEAGRTYTTSKRVKIGDSVKKVTKTKSVRIYAGGYSSSMSF